MEYKPYGFRQYKVVLAAQLVPYEVASLAIVQSTLGAYP